MMSSAEDQLCLNISTSFSSPASRAKLRVSSQQRWARKKQRAEKRRLSPSEEEQGHSSKQRRPQHRHTPEQETEAPPTVTQAPPPEQTGRKKAEKKGERDAGKETGRSAIKTSSLFKHNPDIPDIHRPVVSQLKERIFTSDLFADLDLHPHLVATLNKVLNVSTLTSVQKQTIPVLLSGQDAIVRSQTGSGKTLSYAVPVVQSLQSVKPKICRADGPLVVVVVPTRELAQQTFQTFQKLLKPFTWIVPGVLMGGEKRKAEKARLRKGINILISTPGRLVDHIKNTLSIAFSAVRWLILDEADRTLDLGFEKDLTVILNSLNSTGPSRQNVLLSATLTQGVSRLADVCMNDPVSIHVSGTTSSDSTAGTTAVTLDPCPVGQSESFAIPEALKQFVVVVPSKIRLVCLAAFILDKCKGNKLIVFVSSCEAVDFLLSVFSSVLCGPSANRKPPLNFLRLHGNMKQEERSEVFQQFSTCQCGVLLCTDVAARGLDLPQVTWIIQYNPPSTAAEYVHRVGRTARIGGRGSSLLFLTPAETAFITELASHQISLSEMKLLEILSSLMMDDTYKGRGKYHSKDQDIRERATVLQTEFENVVHSNTQSVQMAKKALQSFLRAYTTYPAHLKHIFHIRSLHLGHAAKSFGLRDAPQGLGAHADSKNRTKNLTQHKDKAKPGEQRSSPGQRSEVRLLCSEFSSGLEEGDAKRKKKRMKKKMGGSQIGEEEEE